MTDNSIALSQIREDNDIHFVILIPGQCIFLNDIAIIFINLPYSKCLPFVAVLVTVVLAGHLQNCYVCNASRLTLSTSFHNTHSHLLILVLSSNTTCQSYYNPSQSVYSLFPKL